MLDLDLSVALLDSKEDPDINDRYALKSVGTGSALPCKASQGGVLSEQSLSKAAASQGLSEVKAAAKAPRK